MITVIKVLGVSATFFGLTPVERAVSIREVANQPNLTCSYSDIADLTAFAVITNAVFRLKNKNGKLFESENLHKSSCANKLTKFILLAKNELITVVASPQEKFL